MLAIRTHCRVTPPPGTADRERLGVDVELGMGCPSRRQGREPGIEPLVGRSRRSAAGIIAPRRFAARNAASRPVFSSFAQRRPALRRDGQEVIPGPADGPRFERERGREPTGSGRRRGARPGRVGPRLCRGPGPSGPGGRRCWFESRGRRRRGNDRSPRHDLQLHAAELDHVSRLEPRLAEQEPLAVDETCPQGSRGRGRPVPAPSSRAAPAAPPSGGARPLRERQIEPGGAVQRDCPARPRPGGPGRPAPPTPSKLAVMSIFLIQEAGGSDMMVPLAAGLFRTRLLRATMTQGILRQPRQLRRRLQERRELHRAGCPKMTRFKTFRFSFVPGPRRLILRIACSNRPSNARTCPL